MKFLNQRIMSFKNAFRGVFVFFAEFGQPHAVFHAIAGLIAIALGIFYSISLHEWMAIGGVITLVLVAEIFNSAIEQLTDLVQPEWDKKAGIVKDMAAGGVLLAAIFALIIGIAIFYPYVMS
jgi:diacylglycerol kinase